MATHQLVQKLKNSIKFEKRKFVLSIGDEGAILVLMNGNTLEQRLFINNHTSPELSKALSAYPKASISILVDLLDQAYIQHTLPPVSSFNIGKLVERRLEKDFGDQDIKAALKLYREKKGRKDWNYLFISINNSPPFSDWLDAILSVENPFAGIFLLPIEAEEFIKKIIPLNPKKAEKQPEWQVLISHNRVGGFRQIVFRNGRVLFTRLAQPIGGFAPEIIAGNIEQETLNTIEYIRRLGFEDSKNLDIYVVASEEVKKAFEVNSLEARSITTLTPFQIAETLKLNKVAEKTDRFGDVVFAAFFSVRKKKVLRLYTPFTKQLQQFLDIRKYAYAASAIVMPMLVLLTLVRIGSIFSSGSELSDAEALRQKARAELDDIQKVRESLPQESEEVVNLVGVYQKLSKETYMPLTMIDQFARLRSPEITVQNFKLSVKENLAGSNKVDAVFSMQVASNADSIDRLLEDVDRFTEDVRRSFRTYTVKFTGLPGDQNGGFQMDLGGGTPAPTAGKTGKDAAPKQPEKIPLEVSIIGPKDLNDDIKAAGGKPAAPAAKPATPPAKAR
ncbi:MAG: hypothetical protein EB060_08595 [Proteobacteria bacterium]|nr:hypothetical protein [Pseudomonadota bacterium]